MDVKFNDLLNHYTHSNLILRDIHRINMIPGSIAVNQKTQSDVCGFVLPIKGHAIYEVQGSRYDLKPSTILHCGPEMTLNKKVIGNKNWEYYLLHYYIEGNSHSKSSLELSNYYLKFSDFQYTAFLEIMDKILDLSIREHQINQLKSKTLIYSFIEHLFHLTQTITHGSEIEKLDFLIEYIDSHLNEPLCTNTLAQVVEIDARKLHCLFQKHTGYCPQKYIAKTRLKKARHILLNESCCISEVSSRVGYEDVYYFSRAFKKYYGLAPSYYRKKYKENPFFM